MVRNRGSEPMSNPGVMGTLKKLQICIANRLKFFSISPIQLTVKVADDHAPRSRSAIMDRK